jgi:hypothetical protein
MRSLTISWLGGVISFEDLRYATKNVSVRVREGAFVVRYWALLYRKTLTQTDAPCRLEGQLRGMEAVILNNRCSYVVIRTGNGCDRALCSAAMRTMRCPHCIVETPRSRTLDRQNPSLAPVCRQFHPCMRFACGVSCTFRSVPVVSPQHQSPPIVCRLPQRRGAQSKHTTMRSSTRITLFGSFLSFTSTFRWLR